MTADWRVFLYPLGFLSALVFGARFGLQWLQSELKGKSTVSKTFWILSLAGNLLLAAHTFIQIQFHVCVVQSCSAVLAWRNLNLMQTKKPPVSFHTVLLLLFLAFAITTGAFFVQQSFLGLDQSSWFRVPVVPWQKNPFSHEVPLAWHIIGFIGYLIFSMRFWVQWLVAETSKESQLPPSFWWLSLSGALLSNIYFLTIGDVVNFIGPAIGMFIYARNLMLSKKSVVKASS